MHSSDFTETLILCLALSGFRLENSAPPHMASVINFKGVCETQKLSTDSVLLHPPLLPGGVEESTTAFPQGGARVQEQSSPQWTMLLRSIGPFTSVGERVGTHPGRWTMLQGEWQVLGRCGSPRAVAVGRQEAWAGSVTRGKLPELLALRLQPQLCTQC